MSAPQLAELRLGADPAAWQRFGFAVGQDSTFVCGTTRVVIDPALPEGLAAWGLHGAGAGPIDGLATDEAPLAAPSHAPQPNGAIAVDHVVAFTPSLDRTAQALEERGIALLRVREPGGAGPVRRQGFFRVGEAVLEVGEAERLEPEAPARFWGLVFAVPDVDGAAAQLGGLAGTPRDAVQPGRRIVTAREQAGLGVPAALITPNPRWRYGV